ncbi:MAG: thermonuclease family protein [Candidatus Peregrinibacteria bacterium]|nr:thermonuclease family protein [Candidatus Peregrinibacteria bacterium]
MNILFKIGFLGLVLLLCNYNVYAIGSSSSWEEVKVDRVIDNKNILLIDGRVVKLLGVDVPDIFNPKKRDQCYARRTFRTLKHLLEKKDVKILADGQREGGKQPLPRHVKLADGVLLAEFMIQNGLARFEAGSRYDKKYQVAEVMAISTKSGLWQSCGLEKSRMMIRKKSGRRYLAFKKKYGHFLAPISVGRVKRVVSGNELVLENGLKVRLLGVETPPLSDTRKGFGCFAEASRDYLESLVLGKKVFLKKDVSDLTDGFRLLRYVFLAPKKKFEKEVLINIKMITAGFGRSFWKTNDQKFQKEFEVAQKQTQQVPCGAWVSCLGAVFDESFSEAKRDINKNCLVKGNISGSKTRQVKTFHTFRSRWYKNLKPEACFSTEREALAAGFRKVK